MLCASCTAPLSGSGKLKHSCLEMDLWAALHPKLLHHDHLRSITVGSTILQMSCFPVLVGGYLDDDG